MVVLFWFFGEHKFSFLQLNIFFLDSAVYYSAIVTCNQANILEKEITSKTYSETLIQQRGCLPFPWLENITYLWRMDLWELVMRSLEGTSIIYVNFHYSPLLVFLYHHINLQKFFLIKGLSSPVFLVAFSKSRGGCWESLRQCWTCLCETFSPCSINLPVSFYHNLSENDTVYLKQNS